MSFRSLDEKILVSPQLQPADLERAREAGITMIVNNRPDGEEADQPAGAEIEAAARAAGLGYRHIPFVGLPTLEQIEELARAMAASEGRTLVFCKSGTRSTYAWALARARQGADGEVLIGKAAAAGYDLEPLRPYLGP